VQIRKAAPSDIDAMMTLDRGSTTASHWSREKYDALFEEAGQAPKRFSLVIEGQSKDEPALLPCILGYLVARRVDREWELENLVVADNVRRQGLGMRLTSELIEHARRRGANAIFLEVRESNGSARALYRKVGFEESGRRKGYYKNPDEDAIIYQKNT
jgi:[ribosomal protein S18]-alanine N-acetyltransferase